MIKGRDSEPIMLVESHDAASGVQISWEQKSDMPTEISFSSPNA
jgi:hypothetical protein